MNMHINTQQIKRKNTTYVSFGPLLAIKTASLHLGIDSIRLWKCVGGMDSVF